MNARLPSPAGPCRRVLTIALGAALLLSSCAPRNPIAPDGLPAQKNARAVNVESSGAENEVVVTLRQGVSPQAFGSDYGATLIESDDFGIAAFQPPLGETAGALALRMSGDARVVTSESNALLETAESRQESFAFDDGNGTLQSFLEQPATEAIHLDRALTVSRGQGVRVAILDTGVDPQHAMLAGRIADGIDFVAQDADPTDVRDAVDNDRDGHVDEAYGHGTHVAGIVARVAPESQLLIARVLDADGRGDVMSVANGIRWAIARGAKVINLSLGMLQGSDAIQVLLEQAEDQGIVCVSSAGNWGAEDPEEYPARSSHVLAIAALEASDRAASFTSYGGFVALGGPGVGVRSAFPGGGYALWSGTSMACPFVSGTAALLLSLHPDWHRSQVFDRLAATARPLLAANPAIGDELGAGALDAGAALGLDHALAHGPDAEPGLRKWRR